MSLLASMVDRLFGYDFFIAYARSDASAYAAGLFEELKNRGFKVFLDKEEFDAGDSLKAATQQMLQKTAYLVLIGSPASLNSKYVYEEVEVGNKEKCNIIPIDIGQTLKEADPATGLRSLLGDRIWVDENGRIEDGPSDAVVGSILQKFQSVRQETKRRWGLYIIIAILILLCGIAYFFKLQADQSAQEATQRAQEAMNVAKRRLALATLLINPGMTNFTTTAKIPESGLSFGIVPFNQRIGFLHKLLKDFQTANPKLFNDIFGAGNAALAQRLVDFTGRPNGGLDSQGKTTDPEFNLVAEPWKSRFKKAGEDPGWQSIQVNYYNMYFVDFMNKLKIIAPQVRSERGIAFLLDLAWEISPYFAEKFIKEVNNAQPSLSEFDLVLAVLKATKEKATTREYNLGPASLVRRWLLLLTPYLSDAPVGVQ